jgi:hypothetical protein
MPQRLKRIGVILPHPRHSHAPALFGALQLVPCEPIALQMHGPWLDQLDGYLLYGPGPSLEAMVEPLKSLHTSKPNVIVWLTEQTPSPYVPARLQRSLADAGWHGYRALYHLRKLIYASGSGGLPALDSRAVRLRTLGALRWLQREGQLRLLAVLTPSHQRFFARMGIASQVVPFGYHATFGAPLALARDIDVVFVGSLHDRRRARIVGALHKELDRRQVQVVIKDGSRERGYAYGDERTRLVNRSKIMLNIMRQPWDDLVFRMLLAAPNGALLLSEPVADTEPFMPGQHFVMAELAQLADSVAYYLRHPAERESIAERARDFVIHQLAVPALARQLLRAAGVM